MYRHIRFALAFLVYPSLLASCGDDFESRTKLTGYRTLGVEATPPEVKPDGRVELLAHDFDDGEDEIEYSWSLCLYSLGSSDNYDCADKDFEFDIGDTQQVTLDLGPDGLDLPSQLELFGSLPNLDGTTRDLERGYDFWIRLRSGPTDCHSCEIDTIKRLRIRDSDQVPNQNPVIEEFSVRGTPRRGETVTLRLNTNAPERYRDPDTGAAETEELLYTWYSSGGETDPPLSYGNDRETELKLPDHGDSVEVAVAVRDGRGGLAVERRVIELE